MSKFIIIALGLIAIGSGSAYAADIAAGKEKAASVCAACHTADGNSQVADFPKLAGQQQDYLVKALRDYKSGARKNAIMAGFAAQLSEKDMENVAAWFSSQHNGLAVKY